MFRRSAGHAVLFLLCLCLVPSGRDPLFAETGPEEPAETRELSVSEAMQPGGTVRVQSILYEDRLKGYIRALDADQITIVDRKGKETSVPWSSVQRLEVQVGVRHAYGTAALIGGISGAIAGAIVPTNEPCFAPGCPEEEMYSRGQAVLIGGALGVAIGLCAEGLSKPVAPRWAAVTLPYTPSPGVAASPSADVRIRPLRGGVTVGLVFAF